MAEFFSKNESAIVSSDRVLYTASQFARSSLLHLQEIGKLRALRPHASSRSCLQSFLFFTVLEGSGELEYGGKRYELKVGDCVFIDCKKPYSHSTGDRLWSLLWIHFNGPTLSSIYQKYCERGGRPVFVPDNATPFFNVYDFLMSTARSSDYMRDMRINEQLSTLIRLIMAESWHPEDRALPKKRASVMEIKSFLDENYNVKISLDELSSRFYISKYYLTHCFKNQFGMSISAYLLSIRITHAKQLLRFSSKTVEEIGYEVGIGAPDYFSRVFKEVEGVSPTVYRRQW